MAKKLIKAQGRKAQRTFQLTEEGLNLLFSRFPVLKYQHRPWDGYWRMIIYDIPEKEYRLRGKLRATLKALGYKFIQKSVWATPMPVEIELEAFLRKEALWGKVLAIKAVLSPEENKRLAKVFNLKDRVSEKR
ncbi:MAG: CRISPR-associated endonuclease Cas2 [Patescibacteria group bacterium]